MPRDLHLRADRKLLAATGSSRRWLRVDVVAPRTTPPGAGPSSGSTAGEKGEAIRTVARGALLMVDLPPGARVVCPSALRARTEKHRTVFELGSLVADQVMTLILCVQFPPGTPGDSAPVRCRLWDEGEVLDATGVEQSFTYATQAASAAQPRDREVAREAASAYAERARHKAMERGRKGDYAKGRAVLGAMAARLREYAGPDREIAAIAEGLEQEAFKLEHLSRHELKRLEHSTSRGVTSRGADGTIARAERHGTAEAAFFVTAVTPDAEATRLAEAAGRALSAGSPSGFGYTVVDGGARSLDPGRGVLVTRKGERGLADALGALGDGVKIAFVRGNLEDASRRRWYGAQKVAFVTLDGWDEAGAASRAFVAYEMALESSRHGRPGWDPASAKHRGSPGCWGGAGDSRAEIEAKLRDGHLCDGCRRSYERAGVDVEAFLCFVAIVRRLATRNAGAR